MIQEASVRAAFEAHMDGLQYNLRRHAERPHQYANTAVQGRWVSWQAAIASKPPCAADVEIKRLRAALRPFADMATTPLSWAIVHFKYADDPEQQTFARPQLQGAINRAAKVLAAVDNAGNIE